MMGHRELMRGGSEYDALTKAKRFYNWKPGVRRWIKRRFNKRIRWYVRQTAKAEIAS